MKTDNKKTEEQCAIPVVVRQSEQLICPTCKCEYTNIEKKIERCLYCLEPIKAN